MTRNLLLAVLMTAFAHGVELQPLEHRVIHDDRTHIRDETDRRSSVWTADPSKATKLLKDCGMVVSDFQLGKGQVLAVFMNDRITEDLTQVVYNRTANETFADYADSGIRLKLKAPDAGKKYSHVTAVIFTPVGTPNHLGMRGMIPDGLSEKR